MPVASAGPVAPVKYAYLDHETPVVAQSPPVQNVWYTVFQDDDVRLKLCWVMQNQVPAAAEDVEVEWLIDGVAWLWSGSLANDVGQFVYRYYGPSTWPANDLRAQVAYINAMGAVDQRGHSIRVRVRMTSAPAATSTLYCSAVHETLEVT